MMLSLLEFVGTMPRHRYNLQKVRSSMPRFDSDIKRDRERDREKDSKRYHDSKRPYSLRFRSPHRSDVEKYKSHCDHREEDKSLSKVSSPSKKKYQKERLPPKHPDQQDKT